MYIYIYVCVCFWGKYGNELGLFVVLSHDARVAASRPWSAAVQGHHIMVSRMNNEAQLQDPTI